MSTEQFNEILSLGERLIVSIVASSSFLLDRDLESDLVVRASELVKKRDMIEKYTHNPDKNEASMTEVVSLVKEMLIINQEFIDALKKNNIGRLIIPRLNLLNDQASRVF